MSLLVIIGTVLGVIGVGLMIRRNVWGWSVGLAQVAVSAWVFFAAKLYSGVLLQIFFFAIQAYGWWHWVRGAGSVGADLPVTRLRVGAMVAWVVAGAVATAAWGELMRRTTDAALPHWDAFILAFSLIAQWWQARKQLENWAGWMVVNVVAIGVYWAKDLRLYAALYGVFFAMAVAGHLSWRRAMLVTGAATPSSRLGKRDGGVVTPVREDA
ncbi:MAG: nicotinamide riboside transporter PnuC [Opitutus sp.]|nr:nicotinamide riboside transporter PnuC [Opitutus sp.]